MPRYFFKVTAGDVVPDLQGTDLAAARHAAVDIVSECIRGNGVEVWQRGGWQLDVLDEADTLLLTLTLTLRTVADPAGNTSQDASLAYRMTRC